MAVAGRASAWPAALVLLPIVVALVAGLGAGLARLGVEVPAASRLLAVNHGALMVSGVVGAVIGLERAVAMGRPLAYTGPVLAAAGALVLVADPASRLAPALFVASAVALLLLFLAFLQRQTALPLAMMTVGVAAWLAGNLVWAGGQWDARAVLPWWMAFLALTIAGERLELARFLPPGRVRRRVLWAAAALLLLGPAVVVVGAGELGLRLGGGGAALLGLWLAVNDTARRTYRRGGVATYAGCALLAAYGWLVLGGLALAAWALEPGLRADSTLHMFFLGFVFGAIFAHAPIILPAITGLPLRFTVLFPAALVALHGSLALRVAANLVEDATWRRIGGELNVAAVVLLMAAVLSGLLLGRRDSRRA